MNIFEFNLFILQKLRIIIWFSACFMEFKNVIGAERCSFGYNS